MRLTVLNPSGGGHVFRFPEGATSRERHPVTIAGRSGWAYFETPDVSLSSGDTTVTLEAHVVFEPPLTMPELMVLTGAEVLS